MRCFRAMGIVTLLLIGAAAADQPLPEAHMSEEREATGLLSPEDAAWVARSKMILERVDADKAPDLDGLIPTPTEERMRIAEEIAAHSKTMALEGLVPEEGQGEAGQQIQPAADGIIIFISTEIPEKQLQEILDAGISHKAHFVLRGLAPGHHTLGDLAKHLSALTQNLDPKPNITLNPVLYKRFAVNKAPTTMIIKNDAPVARIEGLVNPEYLLRQHEAHPDQIDFGVKGATWKIAERDLIEEMQERMAKVNWESKKSGAMRRYWDRFDFANLPIALENRTFEFDPSVVATDDIFSSDGTLIVKSGTQINPLKYMPFTTILLAFDGRDEQQTKWVEQQLVALGKLKRPVVLVVSQVDTSEGDRSFKNLTQRFGYPVYVLDHKLTARTGIKSVPSRVEAKGERLQITEYLLVD